MYFPVKPAALRFGPAFWAYFLTALALVRPVLAHPEGFSGLQIQILADRLHVALTIHTRDTSLWFPPGKYSNYVADVSRELQSEPLDLLDIKLDEISVPPVSCTTSSPEVGMIRVDMEYPMSPPARTMTVWSKHLGYLPRGHEQLLSVEDHRVGSGPVRGIRLLELPTTGLTREENAIEIDLPAPPPVLVAVSADGSVGEHAGGVGAGHRRAVVVAAGGVVAVAGLSGGLWLWRRHRRMRMAQPST